jgi:hypothetical protein
MRRLEVTVANSKNRHAFWRSSRGVAFAVPELMWDARQALSEQLLQFSI